MELFRTDSWRMLQVMVACVYLTRIVQCISELSRRQASNKATC